MARNTRRSRGMKKIEPAPKAMWFSLSVPAQESLTAFVDLSQCASLLNRRFYRQGLNWAVEGFEIFTENTAEGKVPLGQVVCSKLPETWVMSNAWEKGFHAWQRMNNEALEESESVRPRFLDYKVYADSTHHGLGVSANLLPVSDAATAIPGEWEASKMVIPQGTSSPSNSTNREIIAVGANYPGVGASGLDAVSLIEGYAASRGLPNVLDPNTPDDAADADGTYPQNWQSATFNEGTNQDERVLEDMITENNIAPYPFENDGVNPDTMYPGGANQLEGMEVVDYAYITPSVIGGESYLRGGLFPCGLVRFDINNTETVTPPSTANMGVLICVRLVPGPHRGYMCQSMLEA